MPAILDNLKNQVDATIGVMRSAKTFVDGFSERLQAAVALALANGATAEELAPVQDEIDALRAESDALAAAVANHQ